MAEEEAIAVSKEEYEAEQAHLYELDTRLAELEGQWDAFVRFHPDRLLVYPSEFEREQYEILALERSLKDEWSRFGHYMAMRRWTRFRGLPRSAAVYLGLIRTTRRRIREIQATIKTARAEITRKLIIPPEIARLLREIEEVRAELERERERFERKITVPRPLNGVIDSVTGFQIILYEEEFEVEIEGEREFGSVWLYDEEEARFVQKVEAVRVEKTFSVDTSGHESLLAEVTSYTIIDSEDLTEVKTVTDQLEEKAKNWFRNQFVNVTKDGTLVYPTFKITQDFGIQRKNEKAEYEGTIKEWMMTLEGWVEKPRILKVGVGYYVSEEKPTWRTCFIYVEYSHAEEPHPAHKLPRTEDYERFDP